MVGALVRIPVAVRQAHRVVLLALREEALRVRAGAGVVGGADLGEDDVVEHDLGVRHDGALRIDEVGLDPGHVAVHSGRVDQCRPRDRVVRGDRDRPGLEDEGLDARLGGRPEGEPEDDDGGEERKAANTRHALMLQR